MIESNNKSDLGYLGVDFQYKLINSFVEHPNYFRDMYKAIDQNMFTDRYLRTIVGIMKDYYNKHDSVPKYDIILIEIKFKEYSDDDIQFFTETIDTLKSQTTEGIDEIEVLGEHFFKKQAAVKMSNEILKLAANGNDYGKIQRLIDDFNSIGRRENEALPPLNNIDDDLSDDSVVSIPTGIEKLDDILGGGLHKGKVGVIVGASGFGKTSMTTCLCANAAVSLKADNDFRGYKALQIVFEDDNRDINRKYMSKMAQIENCKINESEEMTEKVRDIIHSHPHKDLINNNIRVLKLNTGEVTATDIKNIIKKKINEGFKPDLVVVDYFECLECERGYQSLPKHEQEGITIRKFENMAKELDIAIWVPAQGNRDSFNPPEGANMKIMGGSIKKGQVAQVVLMITRSDEDFITNKANLRIQKNRSGQAGITINGLYFNNGTCTITSDGVPDFSQVLSYSEYNNSVKQNTAQPNVYDKMP